MLAELAWLLAEGISLAVLLVFQSQKIPSSALALVVLEVHWGPSAGGLSALAGIKQNLVAEDPSVLEACPVLAGEVLWDPSSCSCSSKTQVPHWLSSCSNGV